jgi:hypothetical protein
VIVADTGAVLALIDADDRHHKAMVALFDDDPVGWVLPWAILPEVDYLLLEHVGAKAERAFLSDLAEGSYLVHWGDEDDLQRAQELNTQYGALGLGLTDAVVMAVAERLRARAIATLDVRDFGAVKLRGAPRLLPRDG